MRSEAARRVGRRIERPPAHWSLLALILGGLALILAVGGIAEHATGQASTPAASSATAGPLAGLPAIVTSKHGRLAGAESRVGNRVALTFDDGPDPTWTPRIAAALRRLHTPATFFEIGDRVATDPGITQLLHDDGFEIGNHTFTHADVGQLAGWQRDLQISLTESAIAGAAGVRPRLFRPPYSSLPETASPAEARALEEIAARGYLIAFTNYDSEDWRRPGVRRIVENATPPGHRGGVILMHDGGGDRSQTLAALRQLVPRLRARGFRLVPLSGLIGVSAAGVDPPASGSERLRGRFLIDALAVSRTVTNVLVALLIPIAALAVLRALIAVALAHRHSRGHVEPVPGFEPDVSVVVPAFNEAAVIEPAVRSLAGGDYPAHEVIVVDDGSGDGTAELVEGLGLANVTVVRQPNSGKAVALNAGIARARGEIIVTVDADTVFEPETLRALVARFSEPRVGAVAGNTKVGNRRGLLGRWQHIDYVTGFNLDRRLYDVLQCMPTVPGAIGAFRRSAVEEVGGLSSATLAEDTDLTIAIGRRGWLVVYEPSARAYTETPATLAGLWRQRYRWSYGTMQAVWKHKRAIFAREEGKVGRRGLPYLVLFQIALPVLAPLIDLTAIYGVIFLNPVTVLAYWVAFNLVNLALGLYAFRLDREPVRALWAMPAQQLVYRQLMYLVVLQSIVSAVRGVRLRWQHVERTGEVEAPA
jgi:cellulose synthase/poly-beta-1,6-N-acetylglucosamine synthase-like glycosyltransferase/peptidoglycan/xylan/chitin deacetylase (PgdA/CDA1 family)